MDKKLNRTNEQRTTGLTVDSPEDTSSQFNCFQLDFDDRAAPHLVNFYEPEIVGNHYFRWSEPVAMVRLDIPPSDYEIAVETAQLRCGGLDFPFRIYWNDQPIPKKMIDLQKGRIVFPITRNMFIRNDEQRLTFSCKPLNAEKGRRQLGLPIKWIRLQQTGCSEPEFANPTKSRSRLWRQTGSTSILRKFLGIKAPSPRLPIWEMKLPTATTSLRGQSDSASSPTQEDQMLVVASVEINSRHGTGLLIQYMFEDFSQITTVSSQRCFHGDRVRSARHFEVPFESLERHQVYDLVLQWFKNTPPKRAYVVPFYKTELMVAIALSDLFSTEICLHVMDDQCLFEDEIPDALMAEAMNKSNLVFVISPEMRQAYQRRFPNRLYILPPVVPATMILHGENLSLENQPTDAKPPRSKWTDWLPKLSRRSRQQKPGERGIILGNIWNERWLDQLQTTISGSGYEVDWFCNNPDAILLSVQRDELERSGIHLQNPLWGDDLVDELRRRPFAIMPSGALNPEDERQSLARLSLPSRVPFVIAVSHAPIIVLGSPETAAARFVRRFELGTVVDYDPLQFKSAIDQILSPQTQSAIRQRAQQLAPAFSARGIRRWLEESIPLKQPVDNRFETLFSQKKVSNSKPALPIRRANWNKEKLWKLLRRLSNQGIEIQNIIDIGSGDGAWSWAASQVFPAAKYLLIEPQLSRYSLQDRRLFERSLLESHVLELKIFDADSDSDLSQFNAAETKNQRTPPADMLAALQDTNSTAAPNTLDQIVLQHQISGVTLLRMDVQRENFAALAGSIRLIRESAAAIILTADVNSDNLQAKSYGELLTLMDSLGFNLTDETVAKRCPRTEILLSKNLVFVKKEICQKQLSTPAA